MSSCQSKSRKMIPALRHTTSPQPISDEMDNGTLRLLYTFRARHLETIMSQFSAQLRDLGTTLQLRASSMLAQFHGILLEQSAFETHLRDAVIKSSMFLDSASLMDPAAIETTEFHFRETFAALGGYPARWEMIQQTVDYDCVSLEEVVEHLGLLLANLRDLKQANLSLQIELQHSLADVLQYYLTSTGVLIEEQIVSQLEDVLHVTCCDLITLVNKAFQLVKNVFVSGKAIHDHASLEESSLAIDIDALERIVSRDAQSSV